VRRAFWQRGPGGARRAGRRHLYGRDRGQSCRASLRSSCRDEGYNDDHAPKGPRDARLRHWSRWRILRNAPCSPLTIQFDNLDQQQAGFLERLGQLEQQRTQAAQQNAALQVENQRLHRDADEVVNLRGQLARLQADSQELATLKALGQEREKDSDYLTAKLWLARADRFKAWVAAHPEQEIPEFQYLYEDSWLDVVKNNDLAIGTLMYNRSRE